LPTIINQIHLKKGISYQQYLDQVAKHIKFEETKLAGECDPKLNLIKLNQARMKRLNRTITLEKATITKLSALKNKLIWVVLLESWCSDAGQNIPLIAKMADISSNIELILLPRDQNLDVMDHYLTNGGRAVPKLICLSAKTLLELGTWGPRPQKAQDIMIAYKANPVSSKEEAIKNIQLWYARDKGISTQAEFIELLNTWQN